MAETLSARANEANVVFPHCLMGKPGWTMRKGRRVSNRISAKKKVLRAREQEINDRFAIAVNEALERDGRLAMEVADAIGLGHGEISLYRGGQRTPGIGRACLIARELGISLDGLLDEPARRPAAPSADLSLMAPEPPRQERRQSARRSRGAG